MTKELTLNKVAAALVGVAMTAGLAFAFAAERAHASQLSELVNLFIALDIIPAAKAEDARAALAEMEKTPAAPTAAAATCNFTRNLKTGDKGADVKELQKLLNSKGYMVAATGAGSVGMETEFFGPATAGAVKKMQEAFASEILAPLGLTSGTGFFGASTRAKANSLCTPVVVPPVTGDDDDDDDTTEVGDDDDDDDTLSGGEVSLEDFKRLGSPSSVDVGEGEEQTKVAGWEFDVKDADGMLKRVDVNFETTTAAPASSKPYDYFDAVSLFLDGEEIAEVDAGSKDDWSDLAGNVWQIRFTGLSEKLAEDSTPDLVVAVTTVSNLDTDDENTTWNVWVAEDGIRVQDGEGLDQYVGDAGDTLAGAADERTFTTEGAGADDELKVSLNSANPKSSIIKVDTDNSTEDQVVLVFDLKAEGNDISIDTLPITFTVPATDEFDDIVTDVKLEIDGDTYNDYTTASSTTAGTATTTFDLDEDVIVPKDGKVTVKVLVDLNSLTGNYAAGTLISASIPSYGVDAITGTAGDDLSATTNTGSATGETHELQSEGLFAEIVSVDETKTAGDNNAADVGDYEIKFDLTAFDDTFYVSATTSAVFVYHVEDGNGATVATNTVAAVTSTATKESNSYRIDDGESETFTLTVTLNPDVTGYYRIELDSITFGDTAALPYGSSHTASPDEDFETGNLYLNK